MEQNTVKKYIMINKTNGARIESTEKYVTKWLAKGFEVEEIILTTPNELGVEE